MQPSWSQHGEDNHRVVAPHHRRPRPNRSGCAPSLMAKKSVKNNRRVLRDRVNSQTWASLAVTASDRHFMALVVIARKSR